MKKMVDFRNHRFLPQGLFVFTSGNGGEGVEAWENRKLEEKPAW